MQKITPFLWFDGDAEEAMRFYTGVFEDSNIVAVTRYGEAGPGPKGAVMTAAFQICGQDFIALNGGPRYKFTPAVSFVVSCQTQEEIDHYWDRLVEDGQPAQCGWLTDKFGLSWQVAPAALGAMLTDEDATKSARVMQAMMNMIKLDLPALQRAYEGR